MNRNAIKTFAEKLGLNLQNDDTFNRYIDDIFNELGALSEPPLVQAKLISVTSGTATYDFESDMLRILYAFFDDEQISVTSVAGLEAYSKTWRTESGTPFALTQDEEDARDYTLYPNPSSSTGSIIPIHGQLLGEDYPTNALVLIYTDNRETSIPEILALPVAFDLLAREYSYPSDHEDRNFANLCMEMAKMLYTLIGAM